MDVLLLGPVQVRLDDEVHEVGPPQRRHVLAALAVDVGRTVSPETLIDRVWDEPPEGARRTLHSHLARLRRVLAAGQGTQGRLLHRSGGYLLALDAHQIDYQRFRQLAARAGEPSLTDDDRLSLLGDARALWRGEPLTGLTGRWARQVREAWHRQYAEATVRWSGAAVRAGRAVLVVEALYELASRRPLDEPVAGALMAALHASGRTAESLRLFAGLRAGLRAELGTDPGAELQRLHEAILRDEELPVPGGVVRATDHRPPRPAQLPPDVPVFSARDQELATLSAVSARSRTGRPGPAVCLVHGTGGIGKTWLVVHWAQKHRHLFPDGQLFVNLRGFDPSGEPLSSAVALRGFLTALGVPPGSLPAGVDAQAALYRTLAADKRLLVVLDNARDSAQVAPLLPGSASATVLVTSRAVLTGLIGSHGAEPLVLDVLGAADARTLLARRLGEQRLAGHAASVATVIAACGGLPLALGIAAARAAIRPMSALPSVAGELADAGTRLAALEEDHAQAGLRAVLSWSYAALDHRDARVLLLTALAPGADVSLPAVVAVSGLPERDATAALRALHRYSLLTEHTAGRWRVHDLVRLYLVERAGQDLTGDDRDRGLRRLVDFLLITAAEGDRVLNPTRPRHDFGAMSEGVTAVPLAGEAAVLAWMDAEYAAMTEAQALAARRRWWDRTWQLAWALDTYQRWRGHVLDHIASWQAGLAAVRHLHDPVAESLALRLSAHALTHASRHDEALGQLGRALHLARQTGDRAAQAQIHRTFSRVHDLAEDLPPALDHAIEGLRLFREVGDQVSEAEALNGVGWCLARLGRYAQARPYLDDALRLARLDGQRNCEAGILDSLGYTAGLAGDHREAVSWYEQALTIFRELDFTYMEADVLECLGDNHAALGDAAVAEQHWRHAHRLYVRQHRVANADRVSRRLGGAPGIR
ncbi:AfsR/SARP family transcriptional regulator [Actinoplanes sp. RD1]|uniref:AfsR/SARP family transcriptional regulator n=1 Tax=Actinoplanes sp. RD1 TaxID=3064538 RepID=UPI0027426508|nr:BTAD domain-containing putative transcriptional regulator [Actinoplanes sp. RD1]